ncbi:hypothetical protein [Geodermatophilus maliterrae]|uniref:PIN domain-containing protein n=1 Tax=Geodermatophilus maliterrae TaxID=3162531 RepID=A0ABV3XK91_9ACTN
MWAATTPERLGTGLHLLADADSRLASAVCVWELAVEHLPDVHRDPSDRLLAAQAVAEGAVLLTADDRLTGYGAAVRLVGCAVPGPPVPAGAHWPDVRSGAGERRRSG